MKRGRWAEVTWNADAAARRGTTSFATAAGRVGKWNTLLGVRPRAQYTADETARAEKREALRTRLLDWTKLLKGP
ncbi:MAG TPA: hypothetical protein VG389_11500 [Myxococcota bacterium]|nr:hypothetical protein [Myxococcota bacterium]